MRKPIGVELGQHLSHAARAGVQRDVRCLHFVVETDVVDCVQRQGIADPERITWVQRVGDVDSVSIDFGNRFESRLIGQVEGANAHQAGPRLCMSIQTLAADHHLAEVARVDPTQQRIGQIQGIGVDVRGRGQFDTTGQGGRAQGQDATGVETVTAPDRLGRPGEGHCVGFEEHIARLAGGGVEHHATVHQDAARSQNGQATAFIQHDIAIEHHVASGMNREVAVHHDRALEGHVGGVQDHQLIQRISLANGFGEADRASAAGCRDRRSGPSS